MSPSSLISPRSARERDLHAFSMPVRSKQVFKQWLASRPKDWRDGIEVVAMDGFSGFKTAAVEELPDAVEVMDPFHVVKFAGDALDDVRRRVQQETTGH